MTHLRTKTAFDSARSFLFTPADHERRLSSALGGTADAVVADLEDAVALPRRPAARAVLARLLATPRRPGAPLRLVRVNVDAGVPLPEDLAASAGADALVVPKADEATLGAVPGELPIVALVESARGLRDAYAMARRPRVVALALGSVDLAADLGLGHVSDDAVGLPLLLARSQLVRDCAAAGARPPVDGVHTDIRDLAGFRASLLTGRALGMRGRLCLHPEQVAIANDASRPSPAELDWATRVLRLADAGVATLDGEMIDAAVVKRARRLLGEGGG